MTPVIIFEFNGKKQEIPLFLRNIDIQCSYKNITEIQIDAISSDKSELENWGRLIAHLSPGRNNNV